MIKTHIKNIIGPKVSNFNYPIIVNSYGRSGSTVLMKSITQSAVNVKNERVKELLSRSISLSAWSLETSKIKNGLVYKTHDYPPENYRLNNIRMIYTFANPIDVVYSLMRLYELRGVEWMNEHHRHLNAPVSNDFNITEVDQLHLEHHLESWLSEKRVPIAFVRYETMWDYEEKISDFLGFKIEFPPYKKRKAKYGKEMDIKNQIKYSYSKLIDKVDSLDDFFIKNK